MNPGDNYPDREGGSYELSCRLLDPVTGELLAEDLNVFEIQASITYDVGDTGPAGGIVFYITDGGTHGLEAAPEDQSDSATWGCKGVLVGNTESGIGAGGPNTDKILANFMEPGIAARVAANYWLNGYNDWYLPSKVEAEQMQVISVEGGFFRGVYHWCSTEFDADQAFLIQIFAGGGGPFNGKLKTQRVRAIRAF
jgi:hypothetical protein